MRSFDLRCLRKSSRQQRGPAVNLNFRGTSISKIKRSLYMIIDDRQCYIGNVLQVNKDGKEAAITFMKQVRNRNVFVWP